MRCKLLPPCKLLKSSSESDSRILTESNHASSWHIPAINLLFAVRNGRHLRQLEGRRQIVHPTSSKTSKNYHRRYAILNSKSLIKLAL